MTEIFDLIKKESERQNRNIELIASENFVSNNILRAMGSCLTNKYAEGYPKIGKSGNKGRYYGGTQFVDEIELHAINKFKELYNTDYHVNVQPHSGSQANMAAYMAILKPGDTVLSMSLNDGGHLSHGSPVNFSAKTYNFIHYSLLENGEIDYNQIDRLCYLNDVKLILAGASAYPKIIDFEKIAEIADKYGCYFMVDMAHIAGLVAAELHPTPFGFADIITTTTHKTLRGPRGGLIFCTNELARKIDSAVFPGTQGGPLEHIIAAKAICAEEALTPEYKEYIKNVVDNCHYMADVFINLGNKIVTNSTENHLLLLDLTNTNVTGKILEEELDKINITLNKNMIPNDPRTPKETSGVRIGTAAMTTRGLDKEGFKEVAIIISNIISDLNNNKEINYNSYIEKVDKITSKCKKIESL